MQIGQSFSRWITTLAALAAETHLSWQARKSVIVTRENGHFILHRAVDKTGAVLAEFAIGTQLPRETVESLRNHLVLFALDEDNIITRRLSVPSKAEEFLLGIVRNQIERLSPWPIAQAVYGVEATPNPNDPQSLDVQVLIAARARITAICDELQAGGLSVDQIIVTQKTDRKAAPIVLWTRSASESQRRVQSLPKAIGMGLGGALVASLALSLWALYDANGAGQDYDEAAMRIANLQRRDQSRQPPAVTSRDPAERAWALKETAPIAVLTLEALARALPDTAYLTELRLENEKVRIVGLAADAPSLIATLERTKHFSSVHFFAPTTKEPEGGRYRFYIEARVDGHFVAMGN
jgi:general secretion pathway protein L